MRLDKLLFLVIAIALTQPSLGQSKLALKEQNVDESGTIRLFTLSDSLPAKNSSEAISILKAVLNTDENTDFKLIKTKVGNDKNEKHILYQQLYKSVPVYDAYYNTHFTNDTFSFANGEYSNILHVANSIQLSSTTATNIAITHAGKGTPLKAKPESNELIVWRENNKSEYKYAFKVQVLFSDPTKSREIIIDAATGKVLFSTSLVCSVNIACTGNTVYSGNNRTFTGDTFGGGIRLREVRNSINISTLNNQGNAIINAVDFTNPTSTWTSANPNRGALDVHYASERFLDYFKTTFNRNGFDNANHQVTSYVHRAETDLLGNVVPMDNAYFYVAEDAFSFGDGFFRFNSMTSIDIVAHELGHGFAYYEVGFNQSGEAHSLNEGFSDIWGAVIKNATDPTKQIWLNGDEVMANGFSCLRSLRSPRTEGYLEINGVIPFAEGNYPDTRLGPSWDNGNVDPHINATVLGHWFFILSQGRAGTNGIGQAFSVTGIGIANAALVAYNAECALTPSADFAAVRTASINYARTKWGVNSCQEVAVTNAWFAVGVGAAYNGVPVPTITGVQKFCSGSQVYSVTPGNVTLWTPTIPTGVAAFATAGNNLTLTKNAAGNGFVNLTANVANACNSGFAGVATLTNIAVGFPSFTDTIAGTKIATPNGQHNYTLAFPLRYPSVSYNWFVTPSPGWSIVTGQGLSTVKVKVNTTNGTVNADLTACGVTRGKFATVVIGSGGGQPDFTDPGEEMLLRVSPNPAINTTTISLQPNAKLRTSTQNTIQEIKITDKVGNVKRQLKFRGGQTTQTIDVSGLPNDIYTVNVFDGVKWRTAKIIVQ
ncbi:MAG: M4 family metallopeptidase [Chitinophagaceae bacterium]|nr:M4 family metallopeptidase [Chitinophagaceae bacterium]